MDNILSQLMPYVITAVVAYIGSKVAKVIPVAMRFIEIKAGNENYKKMQTISWAIWNKVEEDGRLGQLIDSKIKTFETLVKTKFPGITDEDINLLNKSIAYEFNRYKDIFPTALETSTDTKTPVTEENPVTSGNKINVITNAEDSSIVTVTPTPTTPVIDVKAPTYNQEEAVKLIQNIVKNIV